MPSNITVDTSFVLNIFRRREEIIFRSNKRDRDIAISHFHLDDLYADDVISINNRAHSLAENRIYETGDNITINGDNYTLSTDRFLVTDVYVNDEIANNPVPLFYRHVISIDNVPRVSTIDLSLDSNVTLLEIQVLDIELNRVDTSEYSIDFDEGVIYNNLSSEFNENDNSFTVYFIRYTVDNNGTIYSYLELLNNVKVYEPADFDDLDEELEIIDDGRKVYLIGEDGASFSITFANSGTYTFYILNTARIDLIKPQLLDIDNPWRIRVNTGNFYHDIAGEIYNYSIPEFLSQDWNPEYPYKYITEESSTILSANLVKLNRENIYQTDDYDIDILVDDIDGLPIAAFSTDIGKHGTIASNGATYSVWSFSGQTGIRSIDKMGGIVDVTGITLKDSYEITSSYYFEEDDYEVLDIDFNPIRNGDILTQRVFFFVDPDYDNSDKLIKLYYGILDVDGKIIYCDYSDFDNSTQLWNGSGIYYSEFIDTLSIEGDGIFLVLGEVTVDSIYSSEDAMIRDVRLHGGGIKKGRVDAVVENQNAEVSMYWDIGFWDGQSYPGLASYFVEVPVEILSGAGGDLIQQKVKDLIDKHTALGVYPVVKAYGIDPIITNVVPHSTSIDLEWNSYGSEVLYNVYYTQSLENDWTKSTATELVDNHLGNSYTITGLATGVFYYIVVVGGKLNDGGDWVPLIGQAIGPVDDGFVEGEYNNIILVKTYG